MFEHLVKAFDRIGATARVTPGPRWTIDVRSLTFAKRRSGSPRSREIFELTIPADVEVQAADVVPRDRRVSERSAHARAHHRSGGSRNHLHAFSMTARLFSRPSRATASRSRFQYSGL